MIIPILYAVDRHLSAIWKCKQRHLLSVTVLSVAIAAPQHWYNFKYDHIQANEVLFQNSRMQIRVRNSSSPIIFPFQSTQRIQAITINGTLNGEPIVLSNKMQGAEGADDFALRVGLIIPGGRRPNFLERQVAPQWLIQLLNIVPENLEPVHKNVESLESVMIQCP